MQLPGAEFAYVPENKIRDYLLSPSHPEGQAKARFFFGYGFSHTDENLFAAALRHHVLTHSASLSKRNPYGIVYSVDGPLTSPDGRNPMIRSVWIVEEGSTAPRLITAYPI